MDEQGLNIGFDDGPVALDIVGAYDKGSWNITFFNLMRKKVGGFSFTSTDQAPQAALDGIWRWFALYWPSIGEPKMNPARVASPGQVYGRVEVFAQVRSLCPITIKRRLRLAHGRDSLTLHLRADCTERNGRFTWQLKVAREPNGGTIAEAVSARLDPRIRGGQLAADGRTALDLFKQWLLLECLRLGYACSIDERIQLPATTPVETTAQLSRPGI